MTNIRSRSPVDNVEGIKQQSTSWLNAIVPHHRRAADLSISSPGTPAGWGWRSTVVVVVKKNVRWVVSYRKSTLNWLSNGTLVLEVLVLEAGRTPSTWYPTCVKTNTENNFHQLEEVTTIVCLWRSHCNIQLSINGRDRPLFVPSPTVYHTILQEKAIYKQWRLTVCTGLIFWIQEKRYKQILFPFTYIHRAKRRCCKMIEHLSHCVNLHTEKLLPSTGFRITNSHSPLHFPIRYMQKRREPEAQHSFRGGRGPLSKGKSYLMIWIHKLFYAQYITFSH